MCLQTIKSPVLVAASIRAEGKPRSLTLSALAALVKTHGLDFVILLAFMSFILFATA